MPNASINKLTAPDAFTTASTIAPGRAVDHINISVSNQGIFWQLFEYTQPQSARAGYNTSEVFMPPGSVTIDREGICGIRVRAAIAAASLPAGQAQAVVSVEAVM